jgi:hypothetical protein
MSRIRKGLLRHNGRVLRLRFPARSGEADAR